MVFSPYPLFKPVMISSLSEKESFERRMSRISIGLLAGSSVVVVVVSGSLRVVVGRWITSASGESTGE